MQERVGNFLAGLASRKDEVKRRCRTALQSRAEALLRDSRTDSQHPANAHPTLALVYISSLESDAKRLLQATRSHWGIENRVHWVLDLSFREDENRVRNSAGGSNGVLLRPQIWRCRGIGVSLISGRNQQPSGITWQIGCASTQEAQNCRWERWCPFSQDHSQTAIAQ